MAQARKKKAVKKSVRPSFTVTGHGIGMLLAGMVMGVLGTILWQGMNSRDSEVGSGIRQMIENSRQQEDQVTESATTPAIKPEPQSTTYDFFTVLPEIEVVVSSGEPITAPVPPKPASPAAKSDQPAPDTPAPAPVTEVAVQNPAPAASAYMLQAGSYNVQADAERQKANLALVGLPSTIQKVTIQGRGDFYRVRLGPYVDQARMLDADRRLQQQGIRAMRLKVSRSQPG